MEGSHQRAWGTRAYNKKHIHEPCVFFGLYGLPDFYALWRHKGSKFILWAGTDIIHLKNHYWLEDGGTLRIHSKSICEWINKHCSNWCENEPERNELDKLGIKSHVCPSFLGDINKFKVHFKPGNKVYTSISGDDYDRYGWEKIEKLAETYRNIEFHLYGLSDQCLLDPFLASMENVINHGKVPKEQMNREIRQMQGALRLIGMEGFSEIIAKSVLMGQHPISVIEYPHMLKIKQLKYLPTITKPNIKGREYYLQKLNKFPWNSKT